MACSGGMVKDKDGFAHRRPIEVIWTRYPRELVSELLDGVGEALDVACAVVEKEESHDDIR